MIEYIPKKHMKKMNWNIFLSFWTEKHQFWMDVNVCLLRITGHMKRLTCGWVIMVISSPCTSTNTSPDFRPALYAGVSIPRTFSTCTTFEYFYVGIRRFNVFMLKHDPATFITVATSAPPTILRPHGLFPSLWISRSTTCRHIWKVIQSLEISKRFLFGSPE